MKKLLSTLILSAGMSLSATADTSLLDSSIVGYSDFSSLTADFGTLKDSVTLTQGADNLTLSGVNFSTPAASNRNNMTVTMVLDLGKINTPQTYTALFNAKGGSARLSTRFCLIPNCPTPSNSSTFMTPAFPRTR